MGGVLQHQRIQGGGRGSPIRKTWHPLPLRNLPLMHSIGLATDDEDAVDELVREVQSEFPVDLYSIGSIERLSDGSLVLGLSRHAAYSGFRTKLGDPQSNLRPFVVNQWRGPRIVPPAKVYEVRQGGLFADGVVVDLSSF
jgi:hypothetical protein